MNEGFPSNFLSSLNQSLTSPYNIDHVGINLSQLHEAEAGSILEYLVRDELHDDEI